MDMAEVDLTASPLAHDTAAKRAALRDQLPPRRAMDRAVDTSPAEQRGVGGVDDGVDGKFGDVGLKDLEHSDE